MYFAGSKVVSEAAAIKTHGKLHRIFSGDITANLCLHRIYRTDRVENKLVRVDDQRLLEKKEYPKSE